MITKHSKKDSRGMLMVAGSECIGAVTANKIAALGGNVNTAEKKLL